MGWNILFLLMTILSAAGSSPSIGPEYWTARAAFFMFGALLFLSLFCTIAGKAVRNSLR